MSMEDSLLAYEDDQYGYDAPIDGAEEGATWTRVWRHLRQKRRKRRADADTDANTEMLTQEQKQQHGTTGAAGTRSVRWSDAVTKGTVKDDTTAAKRAPNNKKRNAISNVTQPHELILPEEQVACHNKHRFAFGKASHVIRVTNKRLILKRKGNPCFFCCHRSLGTYEYISLLLSDVSSVNSKRVRGWSHETSNALDMALLMFNLPLFIIAVILDLLFKSELSKIYAKHQVDFMLGECADPRHVHGGNWEVAGSELVKHATEKSITILVEMCVFLVAQALLLAYLIWKRQWAVEFGVSRGMVAIYMDLEMRLTKLSDVNLIEDSIRVQQKEARAAANGERKLFSFVYGSEDATEGPVLPEDLKEVISRMSEPTQVNLEELEVLSWVGLARVVKEGFMAGLLKDVKVVQGALHGRQRAIEGVVEDRTNEMAEITTALHDLQRDVRDQEAQLHAAADNSSKVRRDRRRSGRKKAISAMSERPIIEGLLNKKSGAVHGHYQQRYFMLKGHLLYYYKDKPANTIGGVVIHVKQADDERILDVRGCTIELEEGVPFGFIIAGPSLPKAYELTAENDKEAQLWVKYLKWASTKLESDEEGDEALMRDSFRFEDLGTLLGDEGPADDETKSLQDLINMVIHLKRRKPKPADGYLLKRGHYISSAWHRRYFMLRGTELHYFKTKEAAHLDGSCGVSNKDEQGVIDMRGCSIHREDSPEYCFSIDGPHLKRRLGVAARTSDEQLYWLQRLQLAALHPPPPNLCASPPDSPSRANKRRSVGFVFGFGTSPTDTEPPEPDVVNPMDGTWHSGYTPPGSPSSFNSGPQFVPSPPPSPPPNTHQHDFDTSHQNKQPATLDPQQMDLHDGRVVVAMPEAEEGKRHGVASMAVDSVKWLADRTADVFELRVSDSDDEGKKEKSDKKKKKGKSGHMMALHTDDDGKMKKKKKKVRGKAEWDEDSLVMILADTDDGGVRQGIDYGVYPHEFLLDGEKQVWRHKFAFGVFRLCGLHTNDHTVIITNKRVILKKKSPICFCLCCRSFRRASEYDCVSVDVKTVSALQARKWELIPARSRPYIILMCYLVSTLITVLEIVGGVLLIPPFYCFFRQPYSFLLPLVWVLVELALMMLLFYTRRWGVRFGLNARTPLSEKQLFLRLRNMSDVSSLEAAIRSQQI